MKLGVICDGISRDLAHTVDVMDEFGLDYAELQFVGDDVFLGGGIGMAFRESDAELRGKFDAAIASMKADGSLNALLAKWEIEGQF